MSHEMVSVQGVWECLECPRKLILEGNPSRYQVLEQGNFNVEHFGSKGPVALTMDLHIVPKEDQ